MEDNILDYAIDYIMDNLPDYEGNNVCGAELADLLMQGPRADGSLTYSTAEAIEWVKQYFDDLGDVVEELKYSVGADYIPNVFINPELFMVICIEEVVSRVLSKCEYIDTNWDNDFELTQEIINAITQQAEAQRGSRYGA